MTAKPGAIVKYAPRVFHSFTGARSSRWRQAQCGPDQSQARLWRRAYTCFQEKPRLWRIRRFQVRLGSDLHAFETLLLGGLGDAVSMAYRVLDYAPVPDGAGAGGRRDGYTDHLAAQPMVCQLQAAASYRRRPHSASRQINGSGKKPYSPLAFRQSRV